MNLQLGITGHEIIGNNNSHKDINTDEIHEILGKDENDLLPVGDINGYDAQEGQVIEDTDADILASLTAPVQFDTH
ncbi:CPS_collapsed_G0003610.mRNA.1.CDS.1 [Saccharomyces cerevisiae]|nr:CPS_collapsed_G0003610.mRNA.1.CDS.1 [Saccharomyces cerevisiae]